MGWRDLAVKLVAAFEQTMASTKPFWPEFEDRVRREVMAEQVEIPRPAPLPRAPIDGPTERTRKLVPTRVGVTAVGILSDVSQPAAQQAEPRAQSVRLERFGASASR